jgi:hypothetical protein
MFRPLPIACFAVSLAGGLCAVSASSHTAPPKETLARLPVREVTVFKDGHAFVVHEGSLPTSGDGNLLLHNLPTPVLGTFWPYSTQAGARLTAVTVSPGGFGWSRSRRSTSVIAGSTSRRDLRRSYPAHT